MVYKSAQRRGFDNQVLNRIQRTIKRTHFARTDVGLVKRTQATGSATVASGYSSVKVRAGDRIGEGAPELGTKKGSSKAKAMMEKMGWSSGQALGATDNKGILNPIEQVVWSSRAGLG